jgi:hypothetical protein
VQVHHDHVGLGGHRGGHDLGAGGGLADDLEVGDRGEQGPQAAAEDRVVVGDEHADRVHLTAPR